MSADKSRETPLPRFFDLLSDSDKIEYRKLKESLNGGRNKRGKRLEAFAEMLESVKKYAIRSDEDDWKRCMVCGVCWTGNGLAINTRQLRLLIDKCKSSINGSLHRMGYNPASSVDVNASLIEKMPILKGNFSELRQWTVRQQCVSTPQPKVKSQIKQLQPPAFMSPAANIPIEDYVFDPIPSSQSQEIVNDINQSSIFHDPLCLPMNDWTEEFKNDDIFYDYHEPYNFSYDM
jgi:hypothetical protein